MAARNEARNPAPAPRDTLIVQRKQPVTDRVVHLTLGRADGTRLPDWTPGAHIDLVLPDGATRQYSLLGDPRDPLRYEIAVLREPEGRGGSCFIHDRLTVGDAVGFGGPRNNFRLTPSPRYRFVAGGIGITPILPMLRAATALGAEWDLLYLGRTRSSMPFVHELVADHGERVVVHTSDGGRIDIGRWLDAFDPEVKAYTCGPVSLIDDVGAATAGWRPGWSRLERFTAADAGEPARTTPFEVEVLGSGRVVQVAPGEPVAGALRRAGFDLLTSCSRGVCGTCETDVVSGEPDHRDAILDDGERAAGTCFFPCVSRSKSDRLVIAL
ncbi:2Fe-2S iron-sulfur cluster binding domain-containing protein [Agromyces sp. CFH 90414]|uniref:2Fe-2S iron-sulfur cluster binding domain-containing protein n=1 Tax=Agromyces agglutinans TaxID=2662258 RepID=A0A6I2F8I3_9MICO|nr:PDR/VanB family oxidoreductase [Agromyces agglutinans]MRG58303.1 2Fe-2S iron-sulfur cluster binding domain-containing protein [Agromyces agglutinans]